MYIYIYIGFYEKSTLSIIISSLFIYFSWHVYKVANKGLCNNYQEGGGGLKN